nr:helix-turn-helix transcriptional regulator [uncultured Campylobacter sp.]
MNYDREIEQLKVWFISDFNANELDFAEYLKHCQWRGMLADEKFYKQVPFTKANAFKLYKEFQSPIKRAAKALGLTYKELAEQLGYSEPALKSAIAKDKISNPMMMTIKLLLENKALKDENTDLKAKLNNIKSAFDFIK